MDNMNVEVLNKKEPTPLIEPVKESLIAGTGIDKEIVEQLRKSKEIVGYLLPVVRDQKGVILSGRHRKYADANWPEIQVEVKDPLQRELLILHYNVQRKLPKEETKKHLLRIAKILETMGESTGQICAKICKLVPYSDRYVQELLPKKYKQEYVKSELVRNLYENVNLRLRYFTVPLIPEYIDTVKRAIKLEKKLLNTHDDGQALWSICNKYLEKAKK